MLLRSDHNTHSLTTGDRYVKPAFHQKGTSQKGELQIRAAKVPARAEPLRLPIIEEGHKKNAFPRFDHFFKHKI